MEGCLAPYLQVVGSVYLASGAAGQEAAAPADPAEVQQQVEAQKVARLIHAWMERTCGQLTPSGLARLRQVTHA